MASPISPSIPDPDRAPAPGLLAVDLDGTLIRTDMLHETLWAALSTAGWRTLGAIWNGRGGRAQLKAALASLGPVAPETLPYDQIVLQRITDWRSAGGRTALVTASDQGVAEAIAAHLGLFDEVHGSTGSRNLKGARKAQFLAEHAGPEGYVYIGDNAADLPVWAGARRAVSVGATPRVTAALDAGGVPAEHLPRASGGGRAILRTLRPQQWLKNLLVAVPLIADPQHGASAIWPIIAAFVALCCAASAGYVINDLLDLADDRSHPRKRNRPFASGALSAALGTFLAPILLFAALGVASIVSPALCGVVAVYFVCTTAYSIKLKQHAIVDICLLAFLFTLRVIAGGVAIAVGLSVWILAFSMFIFYALAAVKRLAELTDGEAAGRATSRRGYLVEDRPVLSQMAISSGYLAVLVLALYVNEPTTVAKFGQPWLLWGVCPLLLFWISRLVLEARRGNMHDDPLVFTIENRTSRMVVIFVAMLIAGAAWL